MRYGITSLILFLVSFVAGRSDAEPRSMSAVYVHHALSLAIPYTAERSGDAELKVEVLSPEDNLLGHAERTMHVSQGEAVWNHEIALKGPMPLQDVVWQRVRFTLQYVGERVPAVEQIRSVSTILRRPVLHVLAQKSYIAGAQAAMRVIVSNVAGEDAQAEQYAVEGTVRVELLSPHGQPRLLFAGHLDRRGTVEAGFRFPEGIIGSFPVRFTAETPLGAVETTETIRVEDQSAILLTSEKPIYQPTQTIHLRALALNRADQHAAANRTLTFEVEDPRGNKVFRKAATTDAFGIASAEFTLADEVNLGAYHARAKIGDGNLNNNAAELTVNVERYVLPKFRVAIEFASKDGRSKRDYRPGDHVTGTVNANYFFGKPVDHASVTLKASAMDAELFEAATAEGRTDGEGAYHFDFALPRFFAGRETNHGAAPVVVEATVKDAADHAETRGEPITVSQSPMLITAVPEGGKLAQGMQNDVYLLASYPDGTPAKAELDVKAGRSLKKVITDAAGIATVRISAGDGDNTLLIDGDDRHGNRVSTTVHLETRDGDDQVLLRMSHAVYKPGDRMDITVLSTRQRGAAYIDLVRDGQTILTRDVDLENGRAELSVVATPQMCGTLTVDGYVFGRSSRAVADQRLVFVQPADKLRVEATADAESYRPGGEARVHFRVTNQRGEGVSAALGLEVVDQAVFALAEKQPGFAKVFFYLEQELMKPRYEIHSLSSTDIVQPAAGEDEGQHDRVAQVLFSAAESVTPHTLDSEAGRTVPQANAAEYQDRFRRALGDHVKELSARLGDLHRGANLAERFKAVTEDDGRRPHDAWGTELRIEPSRWFNGASPRYLVRSAGPDRTFGTADDLTVFLEMRNANVYSNEKGGAVSLRMEHDRGPNNGRAEITGEVTDVTGAVIPGAQVHVRRKPDGGVREVVADGMGAFIVPALTAGQYEVRVTAQGFMVSERTFALAPRDRAILSVRLNVGSVSEAVAVDASAMELQTVQVENRAVFAMTMAARAPAAAAMGGAAASALFKAKGSSPQADAKVGDGAHIRSYFPEALYINPEILTDGTGAASIEIPIADSITTWRIAMFASTQNGALGTGTSSIKVFQDFFVDLDLPVTLTQGDRVSIPVAVYNYARHRGNVQLKLTPEEWFALDGDEEKTIAVDAGQVGAAQFTIEARKIGKFKLTLTGRMQDGSQPQDTVVREIEVVPNGESKEIVFNGRLDTTERQTVRFPETAIADASKIFVRLYPGPLSQVIEGIDGILRMPFGCFEQTSSSTYPNVLALDYMKQAKKLAPEVHAKAEGFIATGYQRLLTFEVPGGGFSWFGQAPANQILTAYGLMEFHDMARVYDVDPRLIERTRDWLIAQQQPDGSWNPDTQFINEGATNRYNSDKLRITAYIAWALEEAGYDGPAIAKAKQFIDEHLHEKVDAYTLAVLANFAVENDRSSELAHRVMAMLRDAVMESGDFAWWSAEETGVYATGDSAAVETTGLAVQALLKGGQYPEITRKALAWIGSRKTGEGNWGTTQATIMALRALLLAAGTSGSDAHGAVDVLLNGTKVDSLTVTKDNNDLLYQFVLPQVSANGDNEVELRFAGEGGMAYQIAGRYFVSWQTATAQEPLAIEVRYDRTRLAQDEVVTGTATIRNNTEKMAKMVMVDLGIPPGFELLSEDLQTAVDKTANAKSGRLEKFSMTATQAILYFDSIAPRDSFEVTFRVRAKYPIRASNFASRVYEYYDPAVSATAKPVQFTVTTR
jgi:uncharacterized protein YfaS (alpha-2-macroglobulin family)